MEMVSELHFAFSTVGGSKFLAKLLATDIKHQACSLAVVDK